MKARNNQQAKKRIESNFFKKQLDFFDIIFSSENVLINFYNKINLKFLIKSFKIIFIF